ncbi:conjugal transfer protein TraF [Veronia pacifica]|uniref:Conjugal transfer protein TraF n=1 Tax=Veronia pacifica TaxID=1080227 RepID=A0A1C3ECD2_9GAMM|nr:conjugal transfer protein TraF [Veronia pacifica]ODA30885.1 hypothetical protein A8L45_18915 [Veronia pacifica]
MKKQQLAVALSLAFASAPSIALDGSDARSIAMGGTGVASANHLTAAFYNPAQMTKFDQSDDFGLLLPALNVSLHGTKDIYTDVEHFIDADKQLGKDFTTGFDATEAQRENWIDALKKLDDAAVEANLGLGFAITVPNNTLSVNLFSKTATATKLSLHIDESDLDITNKRDGDTMASTANLRAGMVTEVGLAMARNVTLPYLDEKISLGISPKIQKVVSYNLYDRIVELGSDEFKLPSDYNETTVFNTDIGVSYRPYESLTVGLSGVNLISQQVASPNINGHVSTFMVEPEFTVAAAYDNGWFMAALDVDLNESKQFDNTQGTQYARLGMELDAFNWAQLRVGYSAGMTEKSTNQVTAGFGLSPFGSLALDLAAKYGSETDMGVALEFSLNI